MGIAIISREYALTSRQSRQHFSDPGFHWQPCGTSEEQKNRNMEFNVATNISTGQENVNQAINNALAVTIPAILSHASRDLCPHMYTALNNLREIKYYL